MQKALFIFLGGGIGSVLRVWTVVLVQRCYPSSIFPHGIMVANLLGSFCLGLLAALPAVREREMLWLLVGPGLLGGYTTFSTLTNDSWHLLLDQHPGLALLNAAGSLLAGLIAAAAGWQLARWMVS